MSKVTFDKATVASLLAAGVSLLDPPETVFAAMLEGGTAAAGPVFEEGHH